MTAEIAVLNKEAVALAADSAGTVQTGKGAKIWNTNNKLFSFGDHCPVGILVYGSATFMGVSWESLIKTYRKRVLKRNVFPTLLEYASDFVKFIVEYAPLYRPAAIESFFDDFTREILNNLAPFGSETDISIDDFKERLSELAETFEKMETCSGWSVERTMAELSPFTQFPKSLLEVRFEGQTITDEHLELYLRTIALRAGCVWAGENKTGIAIAGFGEDDLFPSMVEVWTEGGLSGLLKGQVAPIKSISDTNRGIIVPLAQTDPVNGFMVGADPKYQKHSFDLMRRILFEIVPMGFKQEIDKLAPAHSDALVASVKEWSRAALVSWSNAMLEYQKESFIGPLQQTIEMLPKEDLASVAESLLNLAALRKRVTMDPETVGGPVDVAVISKGDGFIWIKRKHYFKPEFNPGFMSCRYGS